ncbi:MAG: hypothetical protein WCK10_03460 [Candidatus Staskawiczbacteria bacterium]
MTKFEKKELTLKKALERVKATLKKYSEFGEKVHLACVAENRYWTAEELAKCPNWNDYHDLETRLENRLWDNWSAFKEWHWDNFGFNTY